ncbi:MAG: hypothetical protein N2171_06550 [Clostridia bacterium]|nr:hypothetical protein [Clostridia bacterium]
MKTVSPQLANFHSQRNIKISGPMSGRSFPIIIIIIIFIGLGIAYALYIPLWTPPDEELHFAYCQYLARHESVPPFPGTISTSKVSLAFHPPLYYLFGSLFCGADDPKIQEVIITDDTPGFNRLQHPKEEKLLARNAYLLRIFTLLVSTLTPICVYATAMLLFPNFPAIGALAAAFTAFNPQFIHVAASISNESFVISFTTIFFLCLVRYILRFTSVRETICAGIVLGICLLTKTSSIFLIPVTLMAILVYRFKNIRYFLKDCLAFFSSPVLIAGWWYKQNWDQLTAMNTGQVWFLRNASFNTEQVLRDVLITLKSFFGYFGSLDVAIPLYYYIFYVLLICLGMTGICKFVIKKTFHRLQANVLTILSIAILCEGVFFLQLNKHYHAFLGKYLFVVIGPIALFVATGIWHIFPVLVKHHLSLFLCMCLAIIPVDSLMRILIPFYKTPAIQLCISQREFSTMQPYIKPIFTLTQTFVSPCSHLCGIRLVFACFAEKINSQEFAVELKDESEQKVLYMKRIHPEAIKNTHYYYFAFPPVHESLGRRYAFSIKFYDPTLARTIFPWRTDYDVYPYGHMTIDGILQPGDLCFDLYFFTGIIPRLQWEGINECIIDQGPYVTVRELQFYDACSDITKSRTEIQKKIKRVFQSYRGKGV